MGMTEKAPVKREDLFEFQFLSEAALSPDGRYAAYVVTQADREKNGYNSAIWMYDLETGKNRLMAERGGAKGIVWLDEKSFLFASDRGDAPDQESAVYYRLSVDGGEAESFLTLPHKAEKLVPMGEDQFLFTARVEEYEKEEPGEYEAERGKDYEIYEELPFWFNGKGIVSRKRTALFIHNRVTGETKRISEKYQNVVSFDLSPEKKTAAWCGPVYEDICPKTTGVYLYDFASGKTAPLTSDKEFEADHVCYMGEKQVFFTGTTYERMGKNPRFYVVNVDNGERTDLPFSDFSVGNSVGSDAKYGGGTTMLYCGEEDVLYMLKTEWGCSQLVKMDRRGEIAYVTKEEGAVTGFDIKNGRAVMTAMRGCSMAELYSLDVRTGEEKKLTGFNDEYLDSHEVIAPEPFRYEGKNGYTMEGYVIHPAGYEPGKKYPAVLEIHGGPKGVSGGVFFHEMQCLASDGYFVIFSNPRGSDGRGEAYADITEAFGRDDFGDLMEFTDQALAHCPDIDENRVGICGGSYGGFMCNWMIGHTDRYGAAVSQRSISNYATKCLYTDIGYYANRLQMEAYPWEDFHKVWSMSPLSGAVNAKTPTLFLQSDEDYRCWMGDAIQMFSAVKRQGTDAKLVLFHGENHELSRSGKPENRMTRLKELEEWFEKYLKKI